MKRLSAYLICGAAALLIAQGAYAAGKTSPTKSPITCAAYQKTAAAAKAGTQLAVNPPPCGNCRLSSGQLGNIVRGVCSVCENR